MDSIFLSKLFEHNNWANHKIIQACSVLSDEQLDAEPQSVTKGSIRSTLSHLVNSQRGYLSLLTQPPEARHFTPPTFAQLEESARISGEGLLALVSNEPSEQLETRLQTTDGFFVDPWVVIVQVINHATEHREQIKSMLNAQGIMPPDLDSWTYGEATNALIPMSK